MSANKTHVEVNEGAAFGGTYFRDIYSGVTGKWCQKSWKEFDQLKDIDQKHYSSSYYGVSINKYSVKWELNYRFSQSIINKKEIPKDSHRWW